jgi:hypothetical protein
MGRRVDVKYRDGSTGLFATGTLVTDSSESVSVEAHLPGAETMHWEIPYTSIVGLYESNPPPVPEDSPRAERTYSPPFKRRSVRLRERRPVVLSWGENELERKESVWTFSISRFGCGLHSNQFFHLGTRVRLEHAGRTAEGRVVHSLKDYSTKLVEVGVGFDQDGSEFWQVEFGS